MALWTPERLSDDDIALWLDAADESTITLDGNDRISQWADKSNHERHAVQGSSSARPHYSVDPHAILFGGSDYLSIPSFNVTRGLYFAVAEGNPDDSSRQTIVRRGWANWTFIWRFQAEGDGGHPMLAVAMGSTSMAFQDPEKGKDLFVGSVMVTASEASAYHNGSEFGRQSHAGLNLRTLTDDWGIGAEEAGVHDPHNGTIREIIFIDKEGVTDDERQRIEGYLAHKWGLEENLPTFHPFRFFPPGLHYILGQTKKDGAPVSRIVRLIDRSTGHLQREMVSGVGTGSFAFTGLDDTSRLIMVLDPDEESGENALILDRVVPKIGDVIVVAQPFFLQVKLFRGLWEVFLPVGESFPFTFHNTIVDTEDDAEWGQLLVFTRQSSSSQTRYLSYSQSLDLTGIDTLKIPAMASTLGDVNSRMQARVRIDGTLVLSLNGHNPTMQVRNIDVSSFTGDCTLELGYSSTSYGGNASYVVKYGQWTLEE